MKHTIDVETWDRKELFEFFKGFTEPFWGITVNVDVTVAYRKAKEQRFSFFLYYLYQSLRAANEVKEFHYRIEDGVPVYFDMVNGSSTINRANGTFGFSYISYRDSFEAFLPEAQAEIARVQATTKLMPEILNSSVIHYSSVPWFTFTSVSHARHFDFPDSCPKITFGKFFEQGDKLLMPVAIHGHHALIDGLHAGQFLDIFQRLLSE